MATQSTPSSRPEAVRNRVKNSRQTYLSFPSKPMPHGIQFIFKKYDYSTFVSQLSGGSTIQRGLNAPLRASAQNRPVESENNSLELPFPKAMLDETGIRINSFERDFLSERIAAGLAGIEGGSVGDAIGNVASAAARTLTRLGAGIANIGETTSMVNRALQNLSLGAAVDTARLTKYIVGNYLPDYISKPLTAVTGAAINPNETLAFEGVNLKNYSFSWELYPSNESDTKQIRRIVTFLKNKSLPTFEGLGNAQSFGGVDVSRAFLNYPHVVLINLLGVSETYWMRFKPAMITSVSVDYAAGGTMAIMKDGVPAGVSLTLQFSELSIHTASDYSDFNDEISLG